LVVLLSGVYEGFVSCFLEVEVVLGLGSQFGAFFTDEEF
jgi:hypothetical protein